MVSQLLPLEVASPENRHYLIYTQKNTHNARKFASQVVVNRMRLTPHAPRGVPHGGASSQVHDISRAGEKPTCSVPALYK